MTKNSGLDVRPRAPLLWNIRLAVGIHLEKINDVRPCSHTYVVSNGVLIDRVSVDRNWSKNGHANGYGIVLVT